MEWGVTFRARILKDVLASSAASSMRWVVHRFYWSLIVFIGGVIVVTFARRVYTCAESSRWTSLMRVCASSRMHTDGTSTWSKFRTGRLRPVINAKATNQLPVARANCRLEWRKLPQRARGPKRKMRRAPKGREIIKKGASRNLVTSVNPIKIHDAEFVHYDMQICQIWARDWNKCI